MKYIIESNDVIGYTPKYAMLFGDGYMIQPLEDLEELNSDYINEHFGDLQDTAYRRGLEEGKAIREKGCEGCKYITRTEFDEPCVRCSNSYKNKWTAKDDKIEVGDTVNLKDGSRDNDGIVTKSWDNDRYFIMWADGAGGVWDKEYIVKTGRHFDIASILEDMRND